MAWCVWSKGLREEGLGLVLVNCFSSDLVQKVTSSGPGVAHSAQPPEGMFFISGPGCQPLKSMPRTQKPSVTLHQQGSTRHVLNTWLTTRGSAFYKIQKNIFCLVLGKLQNSAEEYPHLPLIRSCHQMPIMQEAFKPVRLSHCFSRTDS